MNGTARFLGTRIRLMNLAGLPRTGSGNDIRDSGVCLLDERACLGIQVSH
jgi:hypothetical protein